VRLLRGSDAWTDADESGMRAWMAEYQGYLRSDHVQSELCSLCNHGLYYDMQMLATMRFLNQCAPHLYHPKPAYFPFSITVQRRSSTAARVPHCMHAWPRKPCCA
jgi:hypothetical protein